MDRTIRLHLLQVSDKDVRLSGESSLFPVVRHLPVDSNAAVAVHHSSHVVRPRQTPEPVFERLSSLLEIFYIHFQSCIDNCLRASLARSFYSDSFCSFAQCPTSSTSSRSCRWNWISLLEIARIIHKPRNCRVYSLLAHDTSAKENSVRFEQLFDAFGQLDLLRRWLADYRFTPEVSVTIVDGSRRARWKTSILSSNGSVRSGQPWTIPK